MNVVFDPPEVLVRDTMRLNEGFHMLRVVTLLSQNVD